MSRSLLLLATLFFLLLGVVGREAEAAGPPAASRRAGELIVRFRPGAAPAAPALEAPAAATSGKPATPREAFAFTPAAKFSNPHRPASLKALDQRFGLREARPLGAPARLKASKKNQASPLSSNQPDPLSLNQAGPLSLNQSGPLSLAPRFNAAVAQKANPSNRFNGFSRPDNAAPATSSSNTAAPLAETWLLRLDPAADLNAALAAYRADPAVLYAEPNYEGALAFVPSDPLYSQESKNFKLIGLERAWDVRPGASRGVEVAVIDSGIDAAHPDLASALDLAGSYNFAENNTRIYDDIGHGTRVAGVIGATAVNGEGIAGVAFGCRLMSLDVATSAGVITTANVASAIDWAVAKGADVINLSLTFSAFSQTLADACQAAVASGVVVVAAAGNENQGERPVYPASYNGVLGVGAVAADGRRAPWSNYNETCAGLVDLVAPGEAVFSTIPNGQYNGSYGSGTSFATPMVSGVAALLKTRYPAQSGQAIATHLLATAAPVSAAFDPPNGAGSGLLSAQNALVTAMQPELALGPVMVDDTSTATAANDGNGRLARGEKAVLRVKLKNSGADIDLISATLTTTDPAITISDGAGTWGAIKNGEEAGPSDPFTNITVSPTATAHRASFKLTVWARYNQTSLRSQAFTFELPIEAARTVATGNYFTPQTWTADQTYEIMGTQNFNAGLTIQPGTTVKVAPGVDININGGALKAQGTADKPILLTGLASTSDRDVRPLPQMNSLLGPHTELVDLKSYQKVIYVSATTGSDSTGDGSAAHPLASIKTAVARSNSSTSSDKYAILVAAGFYYENMIQLNKPVDLYGGFTPQGWTRDILAHQTVIDGQKKAGAVIRPSSNAKIDGFRIQNAGKIITNPYSAWIGGAVCSNAGTSVITNNMITGCSGGGCCIVPNSNDISAIVKNNLIFDNHIDEIHLFSNGGIYIEGISALISGNIVVGNTGYDGIQAWAESGSVTFYNNFVCGNSRGIGIDLSKGHTITNCVIADNQSGGPGIHVFNGGAVSVNNSIIANNRISNGYDGNYIIYADSLYMVNSVVYGNNGTPIYPYASSSVSYSDIQGGFPGIGNIDEDPKFAGPLASGVFTAMQYDPSTCQTTLSTNQGNYIAGLYSGRYIKVGSKYSIVAANTENTFTIWGDMRGAGSFPMKWELPDYHLGTSSPCIDAGSATVTGIPSTDLDGSSRTLFGAIAAQIDMGSYEYDPAKPYSFGTWGHLNLKTAVAGSMLTFCTVERGLGLFNQAASPILRNCNFRDNIGIGLECAAGTTGEITSCTAAGNSLDGIKAPGKTLTGCQAIKNGSVGITAGALVACQAEANAGDGIIGSSATDCIALNNGGYGINLASGTALRCRSEGNRSIGIRGVAKQSQSVRNGETGISGNASECYVFGNSNGGIQGNATDCQIIGNTGSGIIGLATLTRCLIRDNTGAAASGASVVDGCTITGNGSGLSVGTKISNSYVAANSGQGVSGGAVQGSTIIGNQGRGLLSPLSVADSWVMFNTGVGIETPKGNISNSSVGYNGGYGILNPADGKTVNGCNLYGNGTYEVYTNLNTATGGYPANTLDFRHNFWGWNTTLSIIANPFPSVNIARIFDLFDTGLANRWYVNYGAQGEFETFYLASAPGDKAPAFLLNVSPDPVHPLNIGPATFTLTFSRAMNTAKTLSVTFGTAAPYTANVVAPAPGWVSPVQWQGSFAVQSDTAQGLQTLRVAGAVDATGFAIPDDTAHTFMIETSGKPSANNGLAIGHGIKMALSWSEEDKPATAAGYNVLRSESGLPGTYVKCNGTLVTAPAFIDSGLKPYTDYFYIVYLVDSGMNAVQWTPPFLGNTGESRAAVRDWGLYR